MDQRKRRVGRPTKAPKSRQKSTLSIRVTPRLKKRLDHESEQNDRSLSQEAEFRLESSFQRQDDATHFLEAAYGRQFSALLELVGRAMSGTGRLTGFAVTHTPAGAANWMEVPYAFDQAVRAASRIFEAVRPPGDRTERGAWSEGTVPAANYLAAMSGEAVAEQTMTALSNPESIGETAEWGDRQRSRLGPAAQRIFGRGGTS